MDISTLRKKLLKGWQYGVSDQFVAIDKEADGSPIAGTKFGKPYVDYHQRLEMLLRVRNRFDPADTAYFITVTEWANVYRSGAGKCTGNLHRSDMESEKAGNGLMLRPIVEDLDKQEFPKCIWGVVWLKRLDDIHGVFPDTFEHPFGRVRFPGVTVCANREGRFVSVIGWRIMPLHGKFPGDHVQCGTQIMGGVSSQNAQSGRRRVEDFGPDDVFATFQFLWNGVTISWRELHQEHPDFVLECVDMFCRSFKPEFYISEFMDHWDFLRDNISKEQR